VSLPTWNDPDLRAGTRIRTALWLASEVGLGNVFTKEQHRAAFAGITQADRRLRDLREYGWVIHTSNEDLTLRPDEQRLIRIGSPVWERGVRPNTGKRVLTSKLRRRIFAESDYQCCVCGIAGGESYPDASHMTAVLAVCRKTLQSANSEAETHFVVQCKRCRAGDPPDAADVSRLIARINALAPDERGLFLKWATEGRRSLLDGLWAAFRLLPKAAQRDIREQIRQE